MPQTSLFHPIGQPFIILPTVDSTNNYAMAQAQKGLASHGSVFLALEQTSGKGQRGKQWLTSTGENIMMSVVLEPYPLSTNEQFLLSASIALSCYDFFKNYAGTDDTRVKWPNDLYWQDRKAGGVLIENVLGSKESGSVTLDGGLIWKYAISGIGININQTSFDEAVKRPVSLKQITGKTWDLIEMAKDLCSSIEIRFRDIFQRQASEIIEDYNKVLFKKGEPVKLKKDNIVFETTIKGVSTDGRLITQDVMEKSFAVGEIEWVL